MNHAPMTYSGAAALATVEHLGETFRVVRQRFAHKRRCHGFALLHGMCPVAVTPYTFVGEADAAAQWFRSKLQTMYPAYAEAPSELSRLMAVTMCAALATVKESRGYRT